MKKIYNYFAEIKKACEIRISEEYTDDAVIALIKKRHIYKCNAR